MLTSCHCQPNPLCVTRLTDVCTDCGHEVATHCYEFTIVEEYQVSGRVVTL